MPSSESQRHLSVGEDMVGNVCVLRANLIHGLGSCAIMFTRGTDLVTRIIRSCALHMHARVRVGCCSKRGCIGLRYFVERNFEAGFHAQGEEVIMYMI